MMHDNPGSLVGTVTTLRTGRKWNRGSIRGTGKRYFFPKSPDCFWGKGCGQAPDKLLIFKVESKNEWNYTAAGPYVFMSCTQTFHFTLYLYFIR
jgi:hypothetical protein